MAALSLPAFRKYTQKKKTPKCQRRIYAGERAVCAEKQWPHESFDLWIKLSGRKVRQGNQIIKLPPFGFCLDYFGSLRKHFLAVKVSLARC